MLLDPGRVAIVGATGPTGIHLARHLLARGTPVRAVSRRASALERAFAGTAVEIAPADALDAEALRRAVEGCGLVVDAIGLPAGRMADHPRTARGVVAAARTAGARLLQVSSYWAYLPHRGEVVDESHPRQGGHPWFRLRREAEDVILAAGGAVAHLPDFFGPEVHTSSVQVALEAAEAGGPLPWLGGAGVAREVAFVPDVMALVADLARREEAYGQRWALPGNGPVTGRGLARLAAEALGRPVEVQSAPAWLLLALSPFKGELREIRPILRPYSRPVRYDTAKLRGLLGEPAPTPFADAVPATLEWIARQRGAG